jgi:fatty acid desaturase
MGCCWAQGGLLQHDLGHNSIFDTCKKNYFWHVMYYTVLMGGSADWWKGRHTRHHASPNDGQLDLDIRTLPLFAWDKKQFKKANKALVQWQVWYWPFLGPPVMLLLYRILNVLWMLRQFNMFEFGMCTIHFSALGYLTYMGSTFNLLAWWVWTLVIGGGYLGWVFAMNHTMFPIYREADERDWVSATLTTTQNVSPSFFVDYFTGHLDYQVEHHLWPRMPRHNYEKVHPRLKALCEKHGFQIYEEGFFQAIASVYRTLHNAVQPETAKEASTPQPKAY